LNADQRPHDDEEALVRSVAIQNAQSILHARQRAEEELIAAKEALEVRTVELERANELVRTIAENAASCLLMLDHQGIPTYMNPAACEETGYSLDEFGPRPFSDLLHAPARASGHEVAECPIRNAREAMIPLKNHQDVFVRRNGTTFPVACSLSPLQRDGHSVGGVLEFRDITDEKLAQTALEDANRRKDQFLATLSHELRTPMTAVLGWARLLKLGLSPQESQDAIDAIEKSAEIQAQLIDDVLDVSRIVAGKMTFNPRLVDMGPVLKAAATTVYPAAAAKGIAIQLHVPASLPPILGDEGRLQQIVWNLLANAVKFTPRGGNVTVQMQPEGSLLRLSIVDDGKGVAAAYLPHLFEPFSQEDGSMTRTHEGIGLGLSIVRSLVELHGGRVRASSQGRGKGSVFTIEFPIVESAELFAPPSRPESSQRPDRTKATLPSLDGLCILVIDDQEFTRDVVTATFKLAGGRVEAADSVREGLAKFSSMRPDVVVCDIAMPGEDGFTFVREVRAMRGAANATPIVALTAFGRPEDRRHALNSGFNAYLKKPVDPEELATTVLRLARK
jgi:PAS domain S-box-containing protein